MHIVVVWYCSVIEVFNRRLRLVVILDVVVACALRGISRLAVFNAPCVIFHFLASDVLAAAAI